MNFHHVRAFCTIVSDGSFSRAADTLHLTQPTISSQIQALERAVGARLFERSAQGIKLTQAGQVFYDYAVQMLELAGRAEQAMGELQGLQRGKLDLGASSVPGHYILPAILARFKDAAPAIDIRLVVANSHDVRNGVRSGDFELGLVGERVRDEKLAYEPLLEDRLVAVVRPEHPLAGRDGVTLADLEAAPHVTRELGSGTRATFERAITKGGLAPERLRVVLELGSTEAVKRALRAVDAVAVLSEWSVKVEQQCGTLCALPILDLEIERNFYLVRRAHGYLSVVSERFQSFLQSELPTLPER